MKRILSTVSAIAFATSLALATTAMAQETHHDADDMGGHHGKMGAHDGKWREKMQERMKEADTDGDGKVSKTEFLARSEKRFTKMDKDGDGFLTEADRALAKEERAKKLEEKGKSPEAAPEAPAAQ